MTRRIVGPFNRVEGDLEISLDIVAGQVAAAYVNSPLYRGFEQILQGKLPADALVLVPRICGICSVAQSAAAALALADAAGIAPPANGRLAANLTLAAENLADHFTHFYLFFMPDFARVEYESRRWHHGAAARFRATTGTAANEVLPARALHANDGPPGRQMAAYAGGAARRLDAAAAKLGDIPPASHRPRVPCLPRGRHLRRQAGGACGDFQSRRTRVLGCSGAGRRPAQLPRDRRRPRPLATRARQRSLHELRLL
jgi:hypothetical protein